MSFGTYARTVRNEQLPPSRRHAALRCAVGHYCPLGFNATWAYVTATARPSPDIRRDTSALLRALDALDTSRSVWLQDTEAFASTRQTEKAAGRRSPRPADMARFVMPQWPSRTTPSRLGLVAAVANRQTWFRALPFPDETLSSDVQASRLAAVRTSLDNSAAEYLAQLGRLDSTGRHSLSTAVQTLHQTVHPGYSPLNTYVLPWLRFANLLNYVARTQHDL
ncbi:hypothetical protein AB0D12_27400 [Streptomyces sp. NPDC048479]|uniref:hypothetical protein n=1 Tax=Streptomyces sp. NPDC048479 TaxID=3154725 RepID=UPI003447EEBA